MNNPCATCTNNRDGKINLRACTECLCPVSASSAFRQLYRDNQAYAEKVRLTDPKWSENVEKIATELIWLLRENKT